MAYREGAEPEPEYDRYKDLFERELRNSRKTAALFGIASELARIADKLDKLTSIDTSLEWINASIQEKK